MNEATGEVFDLGYQHYEGPREGRNRARKALWMNGVRTTLGLGRGSRAKILPVLLFLCAIVPAVLFAVTAVTAGSDDVLPSHSEYYGLEAIILFIFAAILAPVLLCSDKRDGVLFLYLVRPLTTVDYLAARLLAFFSITFVLICSGQVILFIGFTLAADDRLDYLADNWLDIPRFLVAGIVIAFFTSLLPLAVSSFTTRRAFATAFVIVVFLVSIPVAGILTSESQEEAEPWMGDAAKWCELVDISRVPLRVSELILDGEVEEGNENPNDLTKELPKVVPILWYLLLTAGLGFVLWWRYREMRS
jgi:ABC-2 type transport system permease protein